MIEWEEGDEVWYYDPIKGDIPAVIQRAGYAGTWLILLEPSSKSIWAEEGDLSRRE